MTELKKQIKEAGRTYIWLSKRLNIPYQTFVAYMNEYRRMPKEVEQRIKDLL